MINISGSTDGVNLSSEQTVNIVNKIFELLPKSNVELQVIVKSFDKSTNLVEIEIPLLDKNISLTIKIPDSVSLFDKVTLIINFDDKSITINVDGKPDLSGISVKLNDSASQIVHEDFKIKNIKIDMDKYQNQNIIDADIPKTFPIKPVEILSPYMAGKNFDAYILKDIPIKNKINLGIDVNNQTNNISIEPKIPYNTKLIVEIVKIHPPLIEDSDFIKPTPQQNQNPLIDNITKENVIYKNTDTEKLKNFATKNPDVFLNSGNKETIIEKNPVTFLEKDISFIKNTENLIEKSLGFTIKDIKDIFISKAPEMEFANSLPKDLMIKGIVISKPEDNSQKILISDVGVMTIPDLKEKLPFKSVIDLKIKDVVSFERIFEEFSVSNNEPYNSIEKIIKNLKISSNNTPILDEFLEKLPSFDNQILTKIVKYIKAVKNGNPFSVFPNELLEKIDDAIPNKEFLTKMLKDDFIKPMTVNLNSLNNNFSLYILPLLHNDNISKMWLYLFNPQIIDNKDENKKGKKPEVKQRFLLDFSLSELGNMQFEGFVDEPNRKLDLIIKSIEDFKESEKNDINQIFLNSMTSLDYIGELKFKKTKEMTKPLEAYVKSGYFI